jgi:hypothetical protein
MNAGAAGGATISAGAKLTGGAWQARSTTAGRMDIQSTGISFYFDTGLTSGSTFTPTRQILFDSSGNILIGSSSAANGKLQIETQDSVYGQIQVANTSTNAEASIAFISGATAIGTSPTSTNGTDHVWTIGAGAWSIGGGKFGIGNTSANNSIITIDGSNYRVGVGPGITSPSTTLDIGNTGTNASMALRAGSGSAVSSASTGRIRYNESTQHFEVSENGGSYAQVSTGSGSSVPEFFLDNISFGAASSPSTSAGSYTTGINFTLTSNATITGIKFYWAGGSAVTIRCKLWTISDSTQQKTVDVAVSAVGTYTGTFSSSYSATAWVRYNVSIWETSGTNYTKFSDGNNLQPVFPYIMGQHIIMLNPKMYSSGDAIPATAAGSENYAVQPVYTVP